MFDCSDPRPLAEFYRALLGGAVDRPDPRWATSDAFATLHVDAGAVYTFQRVEQFIPPQWPDSSHPQQLHLDIEVVDLVAAGREVIAAGASLLHADEHGWHVYADPAGHPFCLLRAHP